MLHTSLLPFPHVHCGEPRPGSILGWPEVCLRCPTRACESSRKGELELCSYGVNYQRVGDDLLIAGVVVKDYTSSSQARKKRMRELGREAITKRDLERVVDAYQKSRGELEEGIGREKQRVIREYVEQEGFKTDFLKPLQKEILRGLSFVHDYRQINAQITQNINVVLETRYTEGDLENKLEQALPAEKAIYEAAKFLEEKLSVAKFLIEPEWLLTPDGCVEFRVHGMVTKYVRIYQSQYDRQGVTLRLSGSSYGEIVAQPQACGVIPHTLLDNALKYAPTSSAVDVFVNDNEDGVHLAVSSYGPEILRSERAKIFDPFYRGAGAKQVAPEGAGYGLYVAQLVAREHLGTEIRVEQEREDRAGRGFRTIFSVLFPPKAKVVF